MSACVNRWHLSVGASPSCWFEGYDRQVSLWGAKKFIQADSSSYNVSEKHKNIKVVESECLEIDSALL